MKIYNYTNKTVFDGTCFPNDFKKSDELFILCRAHEVQGLRSIFDFDESTVIDCTDLDESVRYTNFDGYDFISMVHVEMLEREFLLREINAYISGNYIVLVIPEHNSPRLSAIENKLLDSVKLTEEHSGKINRMYYLLLHNLLVDFSDMLEDLEDSMQALSEEIVINVDKEQFAKINSLKNLAYTVKKQLRALSYLGEQILLDENKLISKGKVYYFRNVNTRLKKLYDFAESLYNLSSEILYTFDSRMTMKTNDTVNKLTALTLFFGPLTVITGIYGMNFDFMPELRWPLGYPLVIATMITVCAFVFFILKKNKWL